MISASIHKGKERALLRQHPSVFSGAIAGFSENPVEGDLIRVVDSKGQFLGIGFYQKATVMVRIISFSDVEINQEFWNEKIARAYKRREQLNLTNDAETTAYRLLHGEGDDLSGCIIDVYNKHAVCLFYTEGYLKFTKEIVSALQLSFNKQLESIYNKSSKTIQSIAVEDGYLFKNQDIDLPIVAKEHNLKYAINWVTGQKSGFFIDQRDNRFLLRTFCANKKVLNTFSYSGGFTVNALAAGASEVHSVDVSAKAMDLCSENIQLNQLDESKHKAIVVDATKYLVNCQENYDVIVLDPPAYAKSQRVRHNALQAYKRINKRAIELINSGGFLFTFSCSQAMEPKLFKDTVIAAAIEAGRSVRIIHTLTQASDHPINVFYPEGEYLKGLVLHIE